MNNIDTLPIAINDGKATVIINREFDEALSLAFVLTLSGLVKEQNVKQIKLVLTSPGGELPCLETILSLLENLQAEREIRFETVAVGIAASAAALTLAFGTLGCRSYIPGSKIQFHLARIKIEEVMTSAQAIRLAKLMDSADRTLIEKLSSHIYQKFSEDRRVYSFPLGPITQAPFISLAEKMEIENQENFKKLLAQRLLKIFEIDIPMEPETAIAFGLIDQKVMTL